MKVFTTPEAAEETFPGCHIVDGVRLFVYIESSNSPVGIVRNALERQLAEALDTLVQALPEDGEWEHFLDIKQGARDALKAFRGEIALQVETQTKVS